MQTINSGRDEGIWTDHTTQKNRYDNLRLGLYGRASFSDKDNLKILDVGCSTGEASRYFADALEDHYEVDVDIIGVDISEEIVEEAQEVLDDAETQLAQNLDYSHSEFDIVVSKTVLSRIHPDDQTEALKEISRLTDNDGYAAIQVDSHGDERPVTGNSVVITGDELSSLEERTEGFSQYPMREEFAKYDVTEHMNQETVQTETEKKNEGEFLGYTRHVADELEPETEESDDDIIVA